MTTPAITESSPQLPDPHDAEPLNLDQLLEEFRRASATLLTANELITNLDAIARQLGPGVPVLFTEMLFGEAAVREKQARINTAHTPSPVIFERDRMWCLALMYVMERPDPTARLEAALRMLHKISSRVQVGQSTPSEAVAAARSDLLGWEPRELGSVAFFNSAVTTYGSRVRDWTLAQVAGAYRSARSNGLDPDAAMEAALVEAHSST